MKPNIIKLGTIAIDCTNKILWKTEIQHKTGTTQNYRAVTNKNIEQKGYKLSYIMYH